MKKILLIALLLIVGCSKEPINYETTLIERDGVFYTKDTNNPYSGDVFSLDEHGQTKEELTFKDGKVWDGKWTDWYENGQKEFEWTYKDGKVNGLMTNWYENGQKKEEGYFILNKKDGIWAEWYENGQKEFEWTYKDGKVNGLMTNWYENGQKYKEFSWKDGIEIGRTEWHYYKNGQKYQESTYGLFLFGNGEFPSTDGETTLWYKNGQKMSEWTSKGWKRIPSKCWDEDGNECECHENLRKGCK
jgi:antitoxin component YwqK of YwqJK toxin-antitoxin module